MIEVMDAGTLGCLELFPSRGKEFLVSDFKDPQAPYIRYCNIFGGSKAPHRICVTAERSTPEWKLRIYTQPYY